MIKRTIISAFRQMKGNKVSSLINILGLALGMACAFITLLYVIGEFSYEKYQDHRDQLYRVVTRKEGNEKFLALNYGALPDVVRNEIPEVECATPLDVRYNRPFYVKTEKEYLLEKGTVYNVRPEYFDLFTIPLIEGNSGHLLDNPGSIVLSEEITKKYFGDQDPLGKTIYLQFDSEDVSFTVSGVMGSLAGKSGFRPDFITRLNEKEMEAFMGWKYLAMEVFIRLTPTADPKQIEQKLNVLGEKYHPDTKIQYQIQNARDFYLNSKDIYGSHLPKGNKLSILIFSGIGILILLIACINYIILATAESSLRFKEIGLKKVVGAGRFTIISQIQTESLITAVLALPIALIIVERSKGIVSAFFGKEIALSYEGNWPFILGLVGITLMVGIVSGSYISLHLSRLKPIDILHNRNPQKRGKVSLRKLLIGFQLLIFVVLFTTTVIIKKQIKFAFNVHPEFNVENLLILTDNQSRLSSFEVFKHRIESHPDIQKASSSMENILSTNRWMNTVKLSQDPEKAIPMQQYYVDRDYLETIHIPLLAGESFMLEESANQSSVIINETGAKQLGLANPVGKIISTKTLFGPEKEYEIIGVVKDFISGSIRGEINAFLLFVRTNEVPASHIAIRLNQKLSDGGRAHIESVWKELTNGKPIEFQYMSDLYHQLYKKDISLARVIILFTILAIFISCLGLFGLSLFVARRKNKEIGIRKVHGAQASDIVKMILLDVFWVILISNCLAIPITLYAMQKWLSVFAYKITPEAGIFVLVFILSALIVGITLTINALKAAKMNPTDSLRSE